MTADTERAPRRDGARTKARIVDAAAELMGTIGLTRTTTKEIARAAGCSEASLYKHFRDKEAIFVDVLRTRSPHFAGGLDVLPERAGTGDPKTNLADIAGEAVAFYRQTFPMAVSLFASPELLTAHRDRLNSDSAGPHLPAAAVSGYLAAERDLGRLSPAVDPHAAAMALVGACFHRAFLAQFFGDDPPDGALVPASDTRFAEDLAATVVRGLLP